MNLGVGDVITREAFTANLGGTTAFVPWTRVFFWGWTIGPLKSRNSLRKSVKFDFSQAMNLEIQN